MKPLNPTTLAPPGLSAVMADVEAVLLALEIDFYVVGAVARDYWLIHEAGSRPRRLTKDVDLAISVADAGSYEKLIEVLLGTGRFQSVKSSAFALVHQATSTVIDLMPFGSIAESDGSVRIVGAGMESISTVGFVEMAASAVDAFLTNSDRTWRIASLPALLLLKLVAWEDRPERRGKDATDIALLLRHYFELRLHNLYEAHHDLLDDPEEANLRYRYGVGAQLAGRELRSLLTSSSLQPRIAALLHTQSAEGLEARFVHAMAQEQDTTLEEAHLLFSRMVKGFEEVLSVDKNLDN